MKNLIKQECKKYLFNRKVLLSLVIAMGIFLYCIFTFQATHHTGWDLKALYYHGHDPVAFVQAEEFENEVIDENFKGKVLKEYQEYVDVSRLSNEEIERKIIDNEYDDSLEDILDNRYNPMYRGLIFSDEIKEFDHDNSKLICYFEPRFEATWLVERIKEDVENDFIQDNNYEPIQPFSSLTKEQRGEMAQLLQENLIDKPVVRGTFLGFDMLVSNMQFIPFTLGSVLVFCLYGMFSIEKVYKTDVLILTTKIGKNRYIYSKIMTVFLTCTILWIVFQLVNLVSCHLLYGLDSGSATFYEYYSAPSPYGFSYLELYFKQLVVSYFGTLSLGYCIALFSQLTHPIPTFTVSSILILITSWVQLYYEGSYNIASKLLLLLPTQFMSSYHTYQAYTPYTILGFSINLPSLTFIVIFGILIVTISLLYRSMKHRQIKQ